MNRIFDENGKHFEFDDSTRATRTHLATCDCVYIHDKNSKLLGIIKKCNLHKSLSNGQKFMDDVLSHHRTFTSLKEMEKEKRRIRKITV